ncbi:2-phospho-L-lactate guanylyltransferase [Nocardioides sp. zg-ZUI104]|uniref:2-phospho-L-lactate guanylyltransferase n=1 Tax=Nocardioides faecalis TaxID=2803858 RepID=UPI001BCCA9B9|nr:2-phospho-L-lactate guanylyltransferase [Nocardioides faecalis]MBS4754556.1 2-phospho-L-lactate guanylyltransferase [Nocardioides faecalis]
MTLPRGTVEDVQVVVPVKQLDAAKSRLSSDPGLRRRMAVALCRSTLTVAARCASPERVFVLTRDEDVVDLAQQMGVGVLLDVGTDLNSALDAGLDVLRRTRPEATVAVLVADLPHLRPAELRRVLMTAQRSTAPRHVPDRHGTGTTFVSLPPGRRLAMAFGGHSADRFARRGSVPIVAAPPGIRADLDTSDDLSDLAAAALLG